MDKISGYYWPSYDFKFAFALDTENTKVQVQKITHM